MIIPTFHIRFEFWKKNKVRNIYVSSFGNFKDKNKILLTKYIDGQGMFVVVLNDRIVSCSDLIIETWKPKLINKYTFKDNNKRNLCLENLTEVKSLNKNCNQSEISIKDYVLFDNLEIAIEWIALQDSCRKKKRIYIENLYNAMINKTVYKGLKWSMPDESDDYKIKALILSKKSKNTLEEEISKAKFKTEKALALNLSDSNIYNKFLKLNKTSKVKCGDRCFISMQSTINYVRRFSKEYKKYCDDQIYKEIAKSILTGNKFCQNNWYLIK